MSIPPELLKVIAGGGGEDASSGPNPIEAAASGNEPPTGGPMTTPQPKEGVTQAAMVNISMVFQLLEQALPAFGSTTDNGKAILSALKTLSGSFGKERQSAEGLIPAELMQLVQSIPGAGGGTPAQKTMGAMPATQPAIPQGAAS